MKHIIFLILTPLLITGCASTGGVGSYAAGSDSAYLNANRGRPDAQITAAQATQYTRQRQQTQEELQLEQQKQQAQTQSFNNSLSEVGQVAQFGKGMFQMFGGR
jgi:uncharacterized protein YcfL